MVLTRGLSAAHNAYEEVQLQKAIKLSQADIRHSFQKTKVRLTTPRKSNTEPINAATAKPKNPSRVTKKSALAKKTTTNSRSLVVKVGFDYKQVPYDVIRKWKIRSPKSEGELGYNRWGHLNFKGPTEEVVRLVEQRLADHLERFGFKRYVNMPAHATKSGCDVDFIIQTMFAQSTDNAIAIDTHSRLCNAFPYTAHGKKHAGKIPNWHDIRHLHPDELESVLQQGGLQEARANNILALLNRVYDINLARKRNGSQHFEYDCNPPDAADFVPGMLSLDYMTDQEDNSDNAILERLMNFDGIGLKSAMCVLAFAYKRPIFVVDTHVMRIVKWLGWIPKECDNINHAAMFLHNIIPDDIKYNLHQQIWVHCANENNRGSGDNVVCGVCGSSPPSKARDAGEMLERCPLKDLLPSLKERWGNRYKQQLRAEQIAKGQSKVGIEDEMEDVRRTPRGLDSSPSSTQQSTVSSPIVGSPRSLTTNGEGSQTDASAISVTKALAKVKKLNLKRKSFRFEDVDPEQIEELREVGFLLWEMRPMDNTFMEEWGEFAHFPRYRWERPEIMDSDVAVTYEYAKEVLAGQKKHKWSKVDPEDIVTVEAMSAVAA